MTTPEILRLIFVDILIPVITLVSGFFIGKAYQVKVVQKRKENKTNVVSGNNNIVGDGNESVKGDKTVITTNNSTTTDNGKKTTIIASGKNSQAAGRDIINDSKK
jgi:hypothetical protein